MKPRKYRVALDVEFESEDDLDMVRAVLAHHITTDMQRETGLKFLNANTFEIEELDYPNVKIEELVK